ncbi:MAG: hypothetical protein ABSG92_02185 [Conexivisphaerales archaeon]|jgi:hypothetical protein
MVVRLEAERQRKAPPSKALERFSRPENLPKVNLDFVKGVRIVRKEGDMITFEQDPAIAGRKIHPLNKHFISRAGRSVRIDNLEGDDKGSEISVTFDEAPGGTTLHYLAETRLGPLFFVTKSLPDSRSKRQRTKRSRR